MFSTLVLAYPFISRQTPIYSYYTPSGRNSHIQICDLYLGGSMKLKLIKASVMNKKYIMVQIP